MVLGNNISSIGWLALIPNPIIGINEAWFLSNTEKVHALFVKIVEVIDTVNSQTELMKKLATVLDEFDETVKEEVQKYIQKMYDDGELGRLITQIIMSSDLTKYSTLNVQREFRKIYASRYAPSVNDNNRHKYFLQGCCMFKDGDNDLKLNAQFTTTINSVDQDKDAKSNDIILGTLSENGTIENYSDTVTMGHGNGCTYNSDDGYIYAVSGNWYVNSQTQGKISTGNVNVYRYKPDTFTNFDFKPLQDNPNRPGGAYVSGDIAFYNHNLYIRRYNPNYWGADRPAEEVISGTEWDINIVDWNTEGEKPWERANTFATHITIPSQCDWFNFDIQNDKIFCVSNETREIFVYELYPTGVSTGGKVYSKLLWTYKFPMFDYTNSYRIREIEGISVFPNGDIYLMTCGYVGASDFAQNTIIEVFKTNYLTNVESSTYQYGVRPMNHNSSGNAIYVDPRRTDITNPTGSIDKPFSDLNEAVQYINDNPFITFGLIKLMSSYWYQLCTPTNKAIVIDGVKVDSGGNISYPKRWEEYNAIGGAFIMDTPKITFNFVFFRNTSNVTLNRGTITIKNSIVNMVNCWVYEIQDENSDNNTTYPTPYNTNVYVTDGSQFYYCDRNSKNQNVNLPDNFIGYTADALENGTDAYPSRAKIDRDNSANIIMEVIPHTYVFNKIDNKLQAQKSFTYFSYL